VHREGKGGVVDEASAGRREGRVEQPGEGHRHVVGVADVGVAVGER
jgi:hypothetical protein